MAHSQEGIAYFYENVGLSAISTQEGEAYFYANVEAEISDARISRENTEILVFEQVDARISRENIEVLVSEAVLEGWGAVPI